MVSGKSDDRKQHWVVEVLPHYDTRSYLVGTITLDNLTSLGVHSKYVSAYAEDEIGAFNEARKVMARLGFSPAGD